MELQAALFNAAPTLGSWANPRPIVDAPRQAPRIVCKVRRRRHHTPEPEQLTLDAAGAAEWAAQGVAADKPRRASASRPLTKAEARDELARARHADAIAEAIERSAEDPDDVEAHVHLRALLAESLRPGWHR